MKITIKDLLAHKFPMQETEQAILLNQISQLKEELKAFRASYKKDLKLGRLVKSERDRAEKWIFIINEILGEENLNETNTT